MTERDLSLKCVLLLTPLPSQHGEHYRMEIFDGPNFQGQCVELCDDCPFLQGRGLTKNCINSLRVFGDGAYVYSYCSQVHTDSTLNHCCIAAADYNLSNCVCSGNIFDLVPFVVNEDRWNLASDKRMLRQYTDSTLL